MLVSGNLAKGSNVLTFSIIAIVLGYMLGIALSVSDILNFLESNMKNISHRKT